eukprot:5337-Heterococcus_DN1.PRE.2
MSDMHYVNIKINIKTSTYTWESIALECGSASYNVTTMCWQYIVYCVYDVSHEHTLLTLLTLQYHCTALHCQVRNAANCIVVHSSAALDYTVELLSAAYKVATMP